MGWLIGLVGTRGIEEGGYDGSAIGLSQVFTLIAAMGGRSTALRQLQSALEMGCGHDEPDLSGVSASAAPRPVAAGPAEAAALRREVILACSGLIGLVLRRPDLVLLTAIDGVGFLNRAKGAIVRFRCLLATASGALAARGFV